MFLSKRHKHLDLQIVEHSRLNYFPIIYFLKIIFYHNIILGLCCKDRGGCEISSWSNMIDIFFINILVLEWSILIVLHVL